MCFVIAQRPERKVLAKNGSSITINLSALPIKHSQKVFGSLATISKHAVGGETMRASVQSICSYGGLTLFLSGVQKG